MNIDILKVGPKDYPTNCYLVYYEKNCLIIDPGYDENLIVERIHNNDLNPVVIIITHHHSDHDKYAKSLSAMYGIKVFDYHNLFEGDNTIEDFNFNVLYTPGHTTDSISLYFREEAVMFTGDFIFFEDIGATHFHTGNEKQMLQSINKIKTYDPSIKLYPGHEKTTTLEHELKHNPYF